MPILVIILILLLLTAGSPQAAPKPDRWEIGVAESIAEANVWAKQGWEPVNCAPVVSRYGSVYEHRCYLRRRLP